MRMSNQQLNTNLELCTKLRECAHLAAHNGNRGLYWKLLSIVEFLGPNDSTLISEYERLAI